MYRAGFDAFPRYARTSPLVSIPRTPVPLMTPASVIPPSLSRRITEGSKCLECVGWCGCPSDCWIGWGVEAVGDGGGGETEEAAEESGLEGATGSGASRLDMSSPSSARSAMTLPTGTFLVPSGA
jgi:hypothetical protein